MLSKTANSDLEDGRNPIKLNALDRMRLSFAREQISKPSGSIETLLRDRLGDLILLPKSPTIYTSFRELVLAFEADWRLLEECREKWMQFLQTVVQFVSSGDHRLNKRAVRVARYIEDEWRRELLADLGWPWSNSLALEARLSNLPQSESQRILSKNIDDVVKTMATHMTFQLEKLVERCVLGQIEWHGEQACQYSFIDRGFYSPVDGTTLRKSRQIDSTKEVIRSTYVTEISATKAVSIHIHDLVDAVCSPISLAISTIPAQARQVIESVPMFIQDDVRIVEGNLIRERCIQLDQGTAEWTETWTVEEDIAVRYHFDPAIVLGGRYVLTGWVDDPNLRVTPSDLPTSILKSAIDRLFK